MSADCHTIAKTVARANGHLFDLTSGSFKTKRRVPLRTEGVRSGAACWYATERRGRGSRVECVGVDRRDIWTSGNLDRRYTRHMLLTPRDADDEVWEAYWHEPYPTPRLLGHEQWRPGQLTAVEATLAGRDVCLVMPTGGGKSACYQIPAIMGDGTTLIVSPLLSLIHDQVGKLRDLGWSARAWTSGLDAAEYAELMGEIERGEVKLLYVAPERLATSGFHRVMDTMRLARVVVDEAHCVSEWGRDFRPDYLRIRDWLNSLDARPPLMAATASASETVLRDIVLKLGLRDPEEIHLGFNRPNITLDKIPIRGEGAYGRREGMLLEGLKRPDMLPAIVYAGSRKEVESVASLLIGHGYRASAYHAGIDKTVRQRRQADFMTGNIDILVATNAFGMGVDVAGIRSVWHWQWPMSFEAWYQEMGRAGRDGEPARAILFAMRSDIKRVERMLNRDQPDEHSVAELLARLREEQRFSTAGWPERDLKALAVLEAVGAIEWSVADGVFGRVVRPEVPLSEFRQPLRNDPLLAQLDTLWKFADADGCVRRWMLEYFNDPTEPVSTVRCCSACHPVDWVDDYGGWLKERTTTKARRPAPAAPEIRGGGIWFAGGVAKTVDGADALSAEDAEVWAALRMWRKERAGGIPAYRVCNDRALKEIAQRRPRDPDALLAVHGVGPGFVTQHGESLFRLLGSFD